MLIVEFHLVRVGSLETLKLSLLFLSSILNRAHGTFMYNMKYFFEFLYRQSTVLISALLAKSIQTQTSPGSGRANNGVGSSNAGHCCRILNIAWSSVCCIGDCRRILYIALFLVCCTAGGHCHCCSIEEERHHCHRCCAPIAGNAVEGARTMSK
jgi:hypothetical protein